MIRRSIRFVVRLGLLSGVGLALFKVLKGRRSASELGSPSADWSKPPPPNPYVPKAPPEPELVEPVMFEEIIEKKVAIRAVPSEPEAVPDPMPGADPVPAVKKSSPAKVSPAKASPAKASPAKKAVAPAAAGPVKKVEPRKAAAKKPPGSKSEPQGPTSSKKPPTVKKAAKKPQQ